MINKLIDGQFLSQKIITKIKKQVDLMPRQPGLAAVLIGDDERSQLYVKLKKAACEKCGIFFHAYKFSNDCDEKQILECIDFLNKDDEVNGILVQLPLAKKFNTDKIINAIDYKKDIDGFHPINRQNMKKCVYKIIPPLPLAIIELENSTKEIIKNKKIVVLCNNKIIGGPFKCVWGKDNDLKILDLNDKWKDAVKEADVLITAIGKPKFIKKNMIKEGVIVVDAGINKIQSARHKAQNKSKIKNSKSKIVGDVDFKDVLSTVKFITPVPGGVGPMTIAMLLTNLVKIAKK
ncbi:MAG: bifunctional 5,10-methylenetetrahydrofolate dehydrogenase/5,10-methenyltetrahydrofolate cyclohydrolase [Parcubacteria group bacterium]